MPFISANANTENNGFLLNARASAGFPSYVIIPFTGIRPDPVLYTNATIHSMELRKGTEFGIDAGVLLSIE